MRFGRTLRDAVYPEWKDQYIDYNKLKNLLRENDEEYTKWTEEDETKFCDEIMNVQLEKVASFQAATFKKLEERANKAADKLRDLAPEDGKPKGQLTTGRFKEMEEELDSIINEVKELKNYSSINYTGFLKIVKKHDRKRGNNYKIRPMMMMTLSKRPFNSEQGYSPLLNKLSMMYYAVRQQLDDSDPTPAASSTDANSQIQNGERYTAAKFWVHPDNLLEVKTFILRRLPILVYSDLSSKDADATGDPTLTSLYFDNPEFTIYNQKVDRLENASSLRIRWFGQLGKNLELVIEKKTTHENGTSEDKHFFIKEKYIESFIQGTYKMEKTIAKMERQGQQEARIEEFKATVADIQKLILDNKLQPVLRANYTRTAFQKPLDDKVRISIDSSLAFIREDAIDEDRPCRNPGSWHRTDIDGNSMTYPFPQIRQGEISRFPYSVLEIKVKDDGTKKNPQWVEELMASHLVHKAPRFSKFVHGIASLFEDNVNSLPFWISELETDIRKDPQAAFDQEEERKAKKAETEQVVGSFLGTPRQGAAGASYKAAVSSPMAKGHLEARMAEEESAGRRSEFINGSENEPTENGESAAADGGYGTLASVFPSFSLSRYARSRREHQVVLPPGVTKPEILIKDSAPLHVENKVWLANERTFLKWQHICVLISSLAVAMYTAAGDNLIIKIFGCFYLVIAVFAGVWGVCMHSYRSKLIRARSGKDFDNWIGPIVISVAMAVALILNFYFKYREAVGRMDPPSSNVTMGADNMAQVVDGTWLVSDL